MATESYWQRGFNDGYAGKPMEYPNPSGPFYRGSQNEGYRNGYDCGHSKQFSERQRAKWRCPDCLGVTGCATCNGTGALPVSTGWDTQSSFRVGG